MTRHKYREYKNYMKFLGYTKYEKYITKRDIADVPDGFWTGPYPACFIMKCILFENVPQLYQGMK